MGWNFDDFLISKSYVVTDIGDFIQAVMGIDGPVLPETMAQITPTLHHNMEDTEEELMNPYEADAMEMAIRSGHLLDAYARAYHEGPDNPNYARALEEGFRIGKPLINKAAKLQNQINARRGIGSVNNGNGVFDERGRDPASWPVSMQHMEHNAATVNAQKNIDGSFNPYHTQNGKLVTHVISGHNGQIEGYARWYEEAAKHLGMIQIRHHSGTGQPQDRKDHLIPAHYVHRNTITINDRKMRDDLGRLVKELQGQAMQQGFNPQQAYQYVYDGFINEPLVFRHTHMSKHPFESTYAIIPRKHEQARMIRDDEEIAPGEGEDPRDIAEQLGEGEVGEDILHPDLHGKTWHRNMGKGSYNPLTKLTKNNTMIKDISREHGIEEEDVRDLIANAYRGKADRDLNAPGGWGKSTKKRILRGIYDHHMKSGGHPEWYNGPGVQTPEAPQAIQEGGATENIVQPQMAQPPEEPVPPAQPPAHIPRLPPAPAPPQNPPARAIPNAPYINSNALYDRAKEQIQSLQSQLDTSGGRTKLSGLAELLGSLTTRDVLHRSEDIKPELENYIEKVQLELAKSVIQDISHLGDLSVTSPLDVALLSSKVQMGTNDVVTIFHTRGDWREIAKSFNIPHSNVQMVKVALYD